jgi:uncharacterized protein (DUF362 family)
MSKKLNRRSFMKKSAAIGVTSMLGSRVMCSMSKAETVDISVVKGANYYDNTIKAMEQLGGMEKFVPNNSKVAILPNVQRNNPGAYTSPEVVRAVIKMCKDAGAKEINCLSLFKVGNWENTGFTKLFDEEGVNLVLVDNSKEEYFNTIPIENGIGLKEAQIMKELDNNDVLINLPITKDHAGNKFTGTLKNMMGLNHRPSNRSFHKENWATDIGAITHLEQCIADLNTVVKPDLHIVDATEFITTNGPFGPGEIIKPQKVVAGTDRVAMDSYCCTLWGLKPEEIIVIDKAAEHQLGEKDLTKVKIKEIEI